MLTKSHSIVTRTLTILGMLNADDKIKSEKNDCLVRKWHSKKSSPISSPSFGPHSDEQRVLSLYHAKILKLFEPISRSNLSIQIFQT